ncbi:hypothetical protein M514_04663 [Trichuris suis]|uniref:Chromo domain-containing protein n=1 Tax=Trichuris suis TaxID=68888 RepID=A0A085NV84_9BILA|nr:hypothetical protein M514_04663 [Trichuris suis]
MQARQAGAVRKIERLQCKQVREGETAYLVKWVNRPSSDSTWIPEDCIFDRQLIEAFESLKHVQTVLTEPVIQQSAEEYSGDNVASYQLGEMEDGNLPLVCEHGTGASGSEDLNSSLAALDIPILTVPLRPLNELCTDNDLIHMGFEFPMPDNYLIICEQELCKPVPAGVLKELDISDGEVEHPVFKLVHGMYYFQNPCVYYVTSLARVKMSSLKKFISMNYKIPPSYDVQIAYCYQVLPDYFTVKDVINLFLKEQTTYVHFYFRVTSPAVEEEVVA